MSGDGREKYSFSITVIIQILLFVNKLINTRDIIKINSRQVAPISHSCFKFILLYMYIFLFSTNKSVSYRMNLITLLHRYTFQLFTHIWWLMNSNILVRVFKFSSNRFCLQCAFCKLKMTFIISVVITKPENEKDLTLKQL